MSSNAADYSSDPRFTHYMETLGNVPPAISSMADMDDEFFPIYTELRKLIYRDRSEGLPPAFKELLLVVLDITVSQGPGALNHLAAAKRAGLTKTQLQETLLAVFMVLGVSAWGKVGHTLWEEWDDL